MYCQLGFHSNASHGGARMGQGLHVPGFTWCQRTAAPAEGWPRSRAF